MTNQERETQSRLLGELVAIGQLMEENQSTEQAKNLYTKNHLENFAADLGKNMPLYLENLVKLQETNMNTGNEDLVAESYAIYTAMPDKSFENFEPDQEIFLKAYHEKKDLHKRELQGKEEKIASSNVDA